MKTHRLAIVASHVIQYQDPFFRLLAHDPGIDLTVLYCSRHGLDVFRDADMGTTLRWDIDMLAYEHRFLWNASRDLNRGFWRLLNPGIVPALARGRYDAVIFMTGWGAFTAALGMLTCKLLGIPFFLYGDSSFPPPENSLKSRIRARLMRVMMRMTTGFMVSGSLNAAYYRHYGADERRLFLLPWAVDNERFAAAGTLDAGERDTLRASYGIAENAVVFLFSAKLVARKDPLTLLKAYERMQRRDGAAIVFVGDGILRPALEKYAAQQGIDGVHFTGFVNQTALPKLYAIADVFVLPSLVEPRGAVINEAMAVGLPVITTDRCGSIGDIVLDGDNAIVYPAGDVDALAAAMDRLAADATLRTTMGRRSREIIATWDYKRGVNGVKDALRWLDERKRS
jgi:glycosyltransferase involved in cell wall biosynthesis